MTTRPRPGPPSVGAARRVQRAALDRFGVRAALLLVALTVLAVPFGLLLGFVAARWEPLLAADRVVAQALNELLADRPVAVTLTQVVTDLGGSATWWILLSATTVYLLVRRLPRLAAFVAVTGIGGGLLNLAVKAAVGRQRPELAEPLSQASYFAFPSGHTMGSAIGVSVLLIVLLPVLPPRWRRAAVAAGALFAFAVGSSRSLLGVHWASDVLGGWLLSLAWVLTMVALFRAWPSESAHSHPSRPARLDDRTRDPVSGEGRR